MHRFFVVLAATLVLHSISCSTTFAQPPALGAQSRVTRSGGNLAQGHPANAAPVTKAGDAGVPSPDEEALKLFKPVSDLATDWLKRPELFHSMVGLEIMDIPSGRVLFSHNGHKRMVTASIAKVLTTACAYETLGGDYRYHTDVVGFGEIRNARLSGNLVVVPSQDPSFERKDMQELVRGIKSRGIQYVTGRFHLQPTSGGGDHFSTEWLIQDWGQDWMPVSSDFIMDRNILAGDAGGGYPLVTAGSATESSALTQSILKAPWGSAWAVFHKGSVTLYRPDIPVNGGISVGNPNEYNLAMMKMALHNQGVKIDGHDIASGDTIPLGAHVSEPLSEIIRFCLKRSDNLYAQQLLRSVGALPTSSRNLEKASLEDRGLSKMHSWLSSIGVPGSEVVIWDGCGLSRKNAITPHAMNLVLRHMSGPSGSGPFIDLLTHGGEGNARTFRFKTGAMDSVRSISGIVRTSTGQPLAVTAIVNDHQPAVGELRTSLAALIGRLQGLGGLKLTPVAPPPKAAARAGSSSRRSSAPSTRHRRRRH